MEEFAAGVSYSSWGKVADKGGGGSVAFVSSILARNLSFYRLAIIFLAAARVSKITINVGFNLVDFGVAPDWRNTDELTSHVSVFLLHWSPGLRHIPSFKPSTLVFKVFVL